MAVAFLATFIYPNHIVFPLFVSMSAAEEAEVASAMPIDPAPAEPAIAETQPQKPPKRRSPKPQRRRRKSPKKALPILLISRAKRRQRITARSNSVMDTASKNYCRSFKRT
eukprot:TRINITY_DN38415_c0_g1_i6.p1 TRINITY_DN38415_c0_g1~~TRINITY_DN38415_c0_g1_i6.p1  ORF type:complete len:111 (+),score=21.30 TRINITY_DN38415_c0_g1_i6:3-335(+)